MSDSPFVEGTQIQYCWDSTSLGWLKECPRKYYYSMIRGLRSKSESVHLAFGLWYHKALEDYDKHRAVGQSNEDALRTVVRQALIDTWIDGAPWSPDHASKTRETLLRSIIWYVDHFKDDACETVILANGAPAVELSFRMQVEPFILCGHIDRVVAFGGDKYVCDRKTSSGMLTSQYFDQYNPDNQMSLYTLAAKVIYDTPVKGVIIDGAQIAVGFTRFARGFTYRSDAQVQEWLDDFRYWADYGRGLATSGRWPMNDKSCHKYGGCTFRKICSKSPEVRERFIESDYVVNHWNPLEVR